MIIFLSLFYFLYSRKLGYIFNLHNYLKIVILFLFIVFTFKENFLFMHPGLLDGLIKENLKKIKWLRIQKL